MATENNFEEKFAQGLSGIKKEKKQKRISRFDWKEGILFEVEAERGFDPEGGIIEGSIETEIILDCRHPSSVGFGHVAECGHTICRQCQEKFILTCADPGCFLRLCVVQGCSNSARAGLGVFFCKWHLVTALIANLVSMFISGRRITRENTEALRRDYYSIGMQEERKALTNGR